MREIKFRGRHNGLWIIGSLFVRENGECYILFYIDNIAHELPVDPKTIGQYTGLKDKNGKEIYEGDRVRVYEDDEDSCCGNIFEYDVLIAWENGRRYNAVSYVPQYPLCFCMISKRFHKGQALIVSEYISREYEIIGNIHEEEKGNG